MNRIKYGHHISNTFKAMVGVVPNVVISHISGLYGGCASDKAITMDTEIMQTIVSGDCVMVDKGFN